MSGSRLACACVVLSFSVLFASGSLVGTASISAAQPATADATYPDSPGGLKALLQDIFAAMKSGNTKKSSQLIASLKLPNHKQWFTQTFGASEGGHLEDVYKKQESENTDHAEKTFDHAAKNGKTQVTVEMFDKGSDASNRTLHAATEIAITPISIYAARGKSVDAGDQGSVFLGNFVYAEGAFRLIENQVFSALSNAPPMRVAIGGNVLAAKIVHKVQPVYPDQARADHVEGTVALHVVVGGDGAVQEASVISGPPALAQAAIDAVKQWRYQPTTLNQKPVEVDTQVKVTFSLVP
jgi:TonB family protein